MNPTESNTQQTVSVQMPSKKPGFFKRVGGGIARVAAPMGVQVEQGQAVSQPKAELKLDFSASAPTAEIPEAVNKAFEGEPDSNFDPTIKPAGMPPTEPKQSVNMGNLDNSPAEGPFNDRPPVTVIKDKEPDNTDLLGGVDAPDSSPEPLNADVAFSPEPPQAKEVQGNKEASGKKHDGIATLVFRSDPGKYLMVGEDGNLHLNKALLRQDAKEFKSNPDNLLKIVEMNPQLNTELENEGVGVSSSGVHQNLEKAA
jgi:hypothetical protein